MTHYTHVISGTRGCQQAFVPTCIYLDMNYLIGNYFYGTMGKLSFHSSFPGADKQPWESRFSLKDKASLSFVLSNPTTAVSRYDPDNDSACPNAVIQQSLLLIKRLLFYKVDVEG